MNEDLTKQIDTALAAQAENSQIVSVLLADLIKLQEDVTEIKRLLFTNADSKFIETAARVASVQNRLGLLVGDKSNVELR
jgi:hypothetical protein